MARRLLALEFVERAIQRIVRGGLVTTQLTQGIGSPHIFDEGLANGGQHFFALFADLLGPLLVVGVLGLIQNCRSARQVLVNLGAREAGGAVLLPLFEDTQVMEGVNPVLHVIEPSQLPECGDHLADQCGFQVTLGLPLLLHLGLELLQFRGILPGQRRYFGRQQTVLQGILGGRPLALRGGGSWGVLGVFLIRRLLPLGSHTGAPSSSQRFPWRAISLSLVKWMGWPMVRLWRVRSFDTHWRIPGVLGTRLSMRDPAGQQ